MNYNDEGTDTLAEESNTKKIALVGNPNVGKSILFNYLTGVYVEVSNFPGTTVEIFHGSYKNYEVYDTPGIYSVASFNDEETVAKDIIIDSDIVINVVDATHLERDLFLTTQLIEMGKKTVIALNMFDELEKNNISINVSQLSKTLGVPVVPTVAPEQKGFKQLEETISIASFGNCNKLIEKELSHFEGSGIPLAEQILLLEEDEPTVEKYFSSDESGPSNNSLQEEDHHSRKQKHERHREHHHHHHGHKHHYLMNHHLRHVIRHASGRDKIYLMRRLYVNELIEKVIINASGKRNLGKSFGRLIINPLTGIPISLAILYLVYLFIGVIVAGDVVTYTEGYLGNELYEYNVKKLAARSASLDIILITKNNQDSVIKKENFSFPDGINADKALFNSIESRKKSGDNEIEFKYHNPIMIVLFGDFGILTMTVTYILFLLLPLVIGFYFMLSLLEDSGYLPRLATLVDKLLSFIGLNGRAVIPIILGFGCVTMATITTRILGSKRERTIATTILQLAIPCSAQLGVIATLLAAAKTEITIIYVIIIFLFLAIIGTVLNKFIKGESSPLIIDLPQMRLPKANNVIKKTYYRSFGFMKEASPWFFFGAMFISIMQVTGALNVAIDILHPLVVHWLKLPSEAAVAFVMGLVRRDFGAAGLYGLPLNSYQILVAIVTLTLFVPCVTSLIIMFKERGSREGFIIWIGSLALAFFIGGLVAQIFL